MCGSFSCRQMCKSTFNMCTSQCAGDCNSCMQNTGCPAPSRCAAATGH
jgi:hypothetical protein